MTCSDICIKTTMKGKTPDEQGADPTAKGEAPPLVEGSPSPAKKQRVSGPRGASDAHMPSKDIVEQEGAAPLGRGGRRRGGKGSGGWGRARGAHDLAPAEPEEHEQEAPAPDQQQPSQDKGKEDEREEATGGGLGLCLHALSDGGSARGALHGSFWRACHAASLVGAQSCCPCENAIHTHLFPWKCMHGVLDGGSGGLCSAMHSRM